MNNTKRKLKIGWSSNSPWGSSGYATQSNLIVKRLVKAGFPLAFNAFAGFFAGFMNRNNDEFQLSGDWSGVPFYPTLDHLYGSDGLWRNLQNDFGADVVIPFQDVHTLTPQDISKVKRLIPYVPIDRDPVPPAVLNPLRMSWKIITYSQWGHDVLKKAHFHSTMIPHGVDTNIFKPVDKKEAKSKFGINSDTFVFGMIAANKENPPRKGFQQALDAFSEFYKKHPDSLFWFHSWVDQPGGFNIAEYAKFLGLGHAIRFIDHIDMVYMKSTDMNLLMNAFDCLVMPSFSEGFGLPAIEAQSAGVPVIVNDYSSLSELVIEGKTGYKCKPIMMRYDPFQSYVGDADAKEIYKAMESLYASNKEEKSKEARKHAVEKYDIDKIFNNQWLPYFEKIEEEIYGKKIPDVKVDVSSISSDASNDLVVKALEKTMLELGSDKIIVS